MAETPAPALADAGAPPTLSGPAPPETPSPAPPRAPVGRLRAAAAAVSRRRGYVLAVGALLMVVGFGVFVAVKVVSDNLEVRSHFHSAQDCFARYRDAEAMQHLSVCLQVWPEDPDALLLAARSSRRLHAFRKAERFQERYRASQGDNEQLALETVLLRAERGELDAVKLFCEDKIQQNPADAPLILEALARGYLSKFRLKEAAGCLKQWLGRQPNNPEACFLQGQVADEYMDLPAAIASYRQVLKVDADFAEARRRLAMDLLESAAGKEALSHVQYLLKRQPENVVWQVFLARCRIQMGQSKQAEQILDRVLARHPHCAEALAERGGVALQQGRTRAAEKWLRQATEQDPGDYRSHFRLVQALRKNGKVQEADKLQKRLDELKDDLREIRAIVTTQMQARPHDPALHYEVARIAFHAGAVKEALHWLHSALQQDPDYAPAHKALADYYDLIGNPGTAARHRRLAQPDHLKK